MPILEIQRRGRRQYASSGLAPAETRRDNVRVRTRMEWITTTILLDRLRDFDDTVWDQFIGRFRGPLIDFARRLGLSDDAAQDVAQETLATFARVYRDGRYDRDRGRLRSWLFGIAAREVQRRRREDARRERQAPLASGRTSVVSGLPDETDAADAEALWEATWARHALRAALDQVRRETAPTTFGAFERFALHGVPATQVAEELGITPNAVFLAKRRVLRRLEEVCADLGGDP